MPCRDWDDTNRTVTIENPETKRRLDMVTRLLCSTCKTLTPEQINKVSGLITWWSKHQEQDRIRERYEAEALARRKKEAEAQIMALAKTHGLKVDIK